jgi:fumarate reductase subunit C
MTDTTVRHTPYHPRWYRRRISVWWWLEQWSYTRFVLRELTSVFVAIAALMTLWQLRAIAQGSDAWAHTLAQLRSPLCVAFNVFALTALLFHSVSWCSLAPRAMVAHIGDRRLPDWVVAGLNYGAWAVLSLFVAAIVWRLM